MCVLECIVGSADADDRCRVDYDQYYASLAVSTAPHGQLTPEYGGEEEDVKPNLEYLDSLNEYRKRSRSREDVGTGGSTPKMPRTDEHMETQSVVAPQDVGVYTNGVGGDSTGSGDDPIVYGTSLYLHLYFVGVCRCRCSCSACSERRTGAALADHGGAPGGDESGGVHGVLRGAHRALVIVTLWRKCGGTWTLYYLSHGCMRYHLVSLDSTVRVIRGALAPPANEIEGSLDWLISEGRDWGRALTGSTNSLERNRFQAWGIH